LRILLSEMDINLTWRFAARGVMFNITAI